MAAPRRRIATEYCVVDHDHRTGKPTGAMCFWSKRDAKMFQKIVVARNKQKGRSFEPVPSIETRRTLRNLNVKLLPGVTRPLRWPRDLPRR
jgi:hypothetical protein